MFDRWFQKKGSGATYAVTSAVLVVLLFLVPTFVTSIYYLHIFIVLFLFIILSSSLRLIATSGQVSIGHAGMMSIGAYVSGMLARYLGVTPGLAMIVGAVATFVVGFLIGIPFSRLRGIYFSMVMLFFGLTLVTVNSLLQDWTGGYAGLNLIPPIFGTDKVPYYYFFLGLCVVCLVVLYRLENSRTGIVWKAIAQAHQVASSIGIDERGQRILVLAIGCFFAGVAGAGYAHYYTVISQEAFSFLSSLSILVYMMVGGERRFAGPIVGTVILLAIPELSHGLKDYVPYVYAAIMILVAFLAPGGLVGIPAQIRMWIMGLRQNKTASPTGRSD
jgi:branched-chain amino acid transport system permease protein